MDSAMPDSGIYLGIQLILNIFIIILSIVAVIIIMNTLVVSVMERTSEIGTMRALGAVKSFVVKIFITETTFITLFFGALGFTAGLLIIALLHGIGIPTAGNFLNFLGGGLVIRPYIGWGPVLITGILMGTIGLLSWIFPVFMALKVTPLKAIATE
jgi:putative ABC transport system permease protein